MIKDACAQDEGHGWSIDPSRGTTTAVLTIDHAALDLIPYHPPVVKVVDAISSLKTIDFPIPYPRYPFEEAKKIIDALASLLKSNSNVKSLIVRGLGLEEEHYRRRTYVFETLANGQAGNNLDSLWITQCLVQGTEVGFLEKYMKNNQNLQRLTVKFETTPQVDSVAALQLFLHALPDSHLTQLRLKFILGKGDLRRLSTRRLLGHQCSSITCLRINIISCPAPAEPLPATDVMFLFRDAISSQMPSLSCLKLLFQSNVELSPQAFETLGQIVARQATIQHVGIEILHHPSKLSTGSWKAIGSTLGLTLSSVKSVSLYCCPQTSVAHGAATVGKPSSYACPQSIDSV